ncbi:MAG: hypothetical protein GY940_32740 [bacterium]|nr:hypothetical protein [bacterium]
MEKRIKLFFTLFLVFIIFFAFATNLSERQRGGFFSDESGYFSIIQSLAYDFDIRYERKDLLRIKKDFPTGPVGFFLKKIDNHHYYFAKSFAYPLLAAPFYRLFSVHGILLFNGLMLFFVILMAYFLLKQHHPEPNSLGFALVFVLAGVTPIYLWWITADLFNFFVMFGGLFFFFYRFQRPWLFYLSAVFFSFSAFSKPWNVAAIGIIYLILIARKQWKKFAFLSLISVAVFSCFALFLYQQTGELDYKLFQGGERRSFLQDFPYQTEEPPHLTFERGSNMSFDGFWQKYDNSPKIVVSNLFYYFFGRFTGMFIYFFPACFLLALFFFQQRNREDWFVFAAIVTAILIYTQLAPDNYFGGSGSVGNRYFFSIFPFFFFLGFKNRGFKFSLLPVIMALVFLSGVYMDSHHHSTTPRYVGMSFPIRLFPPEKTQYLSLPTNENPRAYGRLLHDGSKTYQVYFLNDNYHDIEGDMFWTKKDQPLEFFLAASKKVKTFRVQLMSVVPDNSVSLAVEYKRKRTKIGKDKPYIATFKNIKGLKIKGRYVYYLCIKSSRYRNGYTYKIPAPVKPVEEGKEPKRDERHLGVKVHIGVEY